MLPRSTCTRALARASLALAGLVATTGVAAGAQPAGLFDGTAGLVETTSELSVPPINHPHSETAIAFWPPRGEYVMLHRSFRVDDANGNRQYLDIARATSPDGLSWSAYDGGSPVLLAEESEDGNPDLLARDNCPPGALCAGALVGDILYEVVAGTPRLTLVYEQGAYGRSAGNYVVSAYSEDGGITWKGHRAIVTPTQTWEGFGATGAKGVGTPSLLKSGSTYWVSYHGVTSLTGQGTLSRGFAFGPDLDTLTRQTTPSLQPGPTGSWTEVGVGKGDFVERNGVFYLAYEGFRGTGVACDATTTTGWHVARATTPTGPWEDMPGTLPFVTDPNGGCGNDMPNIHELLASGGNPDPSVVATGDIDSGQSFRRFSLEAGPPKPPPPPTPPPPPVAPPPPNPTPQQGTAFIGLRLDPPTESEGLCAAVPPRPTSKKGKIRLTKSAVGTQQRIDAEALRRLNAVNAWIDDGIAPRDLCSAAFGMNAFSPGISWVGGPSASPSELPEPRALATKRRKKPAANFTLDRAALATNDRISRALLARAVATRERLDGLTGGNLEPTADLRGRSLYAGLTPATPIPETPDAPPAGLEIGRVPPVGKLRVNAATMRRTQARSQRAIRLANEVIDEIRSGLTEENFQPGSIGSRHLT